MAKTTTKTAAPVASSKPTREEALAAIAGFEFQQVEIIKGKKFPLGERFECTKIVYSAKWHRAFVILNVDGEDQSCDPANIKALKPLLPARIAALKASIEEATDAVLILSGTVRNESEKAVLIKHHAWFKPCWFPKNLVTELGTHDDGEQSLYEVPTWKVKADHGPDGVKALEALQDGFNKMLEPKAVPGKTTIVRRAAK